MTEDGRPDESAGPGESAPGPEQKSGIFKMMEEHSTAIWKTVTAIIVVGGIVAAAYFKISAHQDNSALKPDSSPVTRQTVTTQVTASSTLTLQPTQPGFGFTSTSGYQSANHRYGVRAN